MLNMFLILVMLLNIPDKFYQYTIIDEATRERFIYPFKEQSSYSTVTFVKMAIKYFGYTPETIQTDNGFEFTHFKDTKRVHLFDKLCNELGIKHQLIRPRTPRHNGKVERSHRNDNERFYSKLSFSKSRLIPKNIISQELFNTFKQI